jgi:hypothetical protein
VLTGDIPPIEVGGQIITHPLTVMSDYCREHAATLRQYDWLAGTTDSLTTALIKATRHPWMNSRISAAEGRWLLHQASTAPWETVPAEALLRDADPAHRGGLYDAAEQLFQHFFLGRPRGVNLAKISKCLYLTRPGLVPILDSRLVTLYRPAARTAARTLADHGGPPVRRAYWAAIRQDLLRAGDPLALLRGQARCAGQGGVLAEAASRLSDLRLLDILAWSPRPATQRASISGAVTHSPRHGDR